MRFFPNFEDLFGIKIPTDVQKTLGPPYYSRNWWAVPLNSFKNVFCERSGKGYLIRERRALLSIIERMNLIYDLPSRFQPLLPVTMLHHTWALIRLLVGVQSGRSKYWRVLPLNQSKIQEPLSTRKIFFKCIRVWKRHWKTLKNIRVALPTQPNPEYVRFFCLYILKEMDEKPVW